MRWLSNVFGSESQDHSLTASPETGFALYVTQWCGYCRRVTRVIDELGIADRVEIRDVNADPEFRRDLLSARGRGTVPVLRISAEQGEDTFLPESADIIRWLRAELG